MIKEQRIFKKRRLFPWNFNKMFYYIESKRYTERTETGKDREG